MLRIISSKSRWFAAHKTTIRNGFAPRLETLESRRNPTVTGVDLATAIAPEDPAPPPSDDFQAALIEFGVENDLGPAEESPYFTEAPLPSSPIFLPDNDNVLATPDVPDLPPGVAAEEPPEVSPPEGISDNPVYGERDETMADDDKPATPTMVLEDDKSLTPNADVGTEPEVVEPKLVLNAAEADTSGQLDSPPSANDLQGDEVHAAPVDELPKSVSGLPVVNFGTSQPGQSIKVLNQPASPWGMTLLQELQRQDHQPKAPLVPVLDNSDSESESVLSNEDSAEDEPVHNLMEGTGFGQSEEVASCDWEPDTEAPTAEPTEE